MDTLGLGYAVSSSDSEEEGDANNGNVSSNPLPPCNRVSETESDELEGVPPEPKGECDSEVQKRIARFVDLHREKNRAFQDNVRSKKEFSNPYLLEKAVAYFDIDEVASNFDTAVFAPHGMELHEYADALALEQRKSAERRAQRQQQQQSRTEIAFVSSTEQQD